MRVKRWLNFSLQKARDWAGGGWGEGKGRKQDG